MTTLLKPVDNLKQCLALILELEDATAWAPGWRRPVRRITLACEWSVHRFEPRVQIRPNGQSTEEIS